MGACRACAITRRSGRQALCPAQPRASRTDRDAKPLLTSGATADGHGAGITTSPAAEDPGVRGALVAAPVITRGAGDLDASLDTSQRATALLVQRTLEEHYAFVLVYTHLAPTILTPIETPIREFLRSQPKAVAYAARMLEGYFPELATKSQSGARSMPAHAVA